MHTRRQPMRQLSLPRHAEACLSLSLLMQHPLCLQMLRDAHLPRPWYALATLVAVSRATIRLPSACATQHTTSNTSPRPGAEQSQSNKSPYTSAPPMLHPSM